MPSRATLSDVGTGALGHRFAALREAAGVVAAAAHRRTLTGVAFVGVTGSCGKTTTKELIAAVLRSRLRGRTSPAQGNGTGVVAKTILRTSRRDQFCVIEVAMGDPGMLATAARLVQPRVAVVTNIGTDHRSIYRTRGRIAAEKRALLDAAPGDGVAVVNADDQYALSLGERFRGEVITFGRSAEAMVRAHDIAASWPEPLSFTLESACWTGEVRTRLYGRHWVYSALAALATAGALGIPLEAAAMALGDAPPTPGRMSPVFRDGVTFMLDDVKAPVWALDAVVEFLADARADRKIAVIGTLSDYPGAGSRTYRRVAQRLLEVADEVVFVGRNAWYVEKLEDEAVTACEGLTDAASHLRERLRSGDLVVLKGSLRIDGLRRLVAQAGPYHPLDR